jgi:hypothetical protein
VVRRDPAYVGEPDDEVTKRWDEFKVDGGVPVRLLERISFALVAARFPQRS